MGDKSFQVPPSQITHAVMDETNTINIRFESIITWNLTGNFRVDETLLETKIERERERGDREGNPKRVCLRTVTVFKNFRATAPAHLLFSVQLERARESYFLSRK